MTDELSDKDPFAEDEKVDEENLITDGMVKKVTYLIHKLAEMKGQEYKDIQKKCRSIFKYANLAKVSKEQGHAIINKLIELTGGEEEKPEQGETVKDDGTEHLPTKPDDRLKNIEKTIDVQDESVVTSTMREAIRAAVDITVKEVVDKNVPVQGLGGFVLEIGKVIFEAKMTEEAGK